MLQSHVALESRLLDSNRISLNLFPDPNVDLVTPPQPMSAPQVQSISHQGTHVFSRRSPHHTHTLTHMHTHNQVDCVYHVLLFSCHFWYNTSGMLLLPQTPQFTSRFLHLGVRSPPPPPALISIRAATRPRCLYPCLCVCVCV